MVGSGSHLDGWRNEDLVAPTAFVVTLSYRYPEGSTEAERRRTDQTALDRVVRLSGAFAAFATEADGSPPIR